MELKVDEIIKKLESGEIDWNNVYDIKIIDKENIEKLKDFSNIKNILNLSLKVAINSLESQ